VTLWQSFGDRIHDELVLLAPEGRYIPKLFTRRYIDRGRHARRLREAQKVRAGIYLADGAVQASQLTADGRHVQHADSDSWHVLAVDANGEIRGCARYRHLTGRVCFNDLGVRESWLARCEQWGLTLRAAWESEIALAKRRGMAFAEVGGWAHRARETPHHRGVAHGHGHLWPGADSGRLRGHQHGHRTPPFLLDFAAHRRPLAGAPRNGTTPVLRPSIPVPDGSPAIRFELAGRLVPKMGGTIERPAGGGFRIGGAGSAGEPSRGSASAAAPAAAMAGPAPAQVGSRRQSVSRRRVDHP